jgi:hypothetical protein
MNEPANFDTNLKRFRLFSGMILSYFFLLFSFRGKKMDFETGGFFDVSYF